ncbi:ferrochelatase [Syncephalis fuscata]|nr:ferrochelatase [Syncephalis fuscata]
MLRHFITIITAVIIERHACLIRYGSSVAIDSKTIPAKNEQHSNVKTAILLMNLGGPRNSDEVYPFLHRLFADPDIIPLPFQKKIAPWIARRRTPKIIKQYNEIGGGSPIRAWTERQGELMTQLLDEQSPATAPHKVYIGFRYAAPLTEDAVSAMLADGVTRAIAFTQYPQSSLNELWRRTTEIDKTNRIQWSLIDRWGTHPGLVEAFAHNIKEKLNSYPAEQRDNVVILYSAHSLPMSVVNRGDPYPAEVAATVNAVKDCLARDGIRNAYRLVWQSQVGPSAWLGPQTSDAIQGLAKQGHKDQLLVPIAFTSDHIETLYELDHEYGEEAKKAGVTGYRRVESLNDGPLFIQALASVVKQHLAETAPVSTQWLLQCPGCNNETCCNMRTFFKHSNQRDRNDK